MMIDKIENIIKVIEGIMESNEYKIQECKERNENYRYLVGKNEGLFYAHILLTEAFK